MEQSKLLETAEAVISSFRKMVDNANGDQITAAGALIELTMAINKLSEEVQKGKETVAQLGKLKEMLTGSMMTFSEEKADKKPPSSPDAEKILQNILSKLSQPK